MAHLYSAPADLEIVVQKSDATLLECLLCRETFQDKNELIKHGESHNVSQTYQCKVCFKYFSLRKTWKSHAKVHRKRDKVCTICNKGFYNPSRLKYHMEVMHGKDRCHACPQCSKTFTAAQSLKGHIRNSHRLKEYTCVTCNRKFAKKYALAEHLASIHLTVRTFHCDICDKLYATKRGIRYHISKCHTDEIYKCPYCSKKLANKHSMNVHVRNIHMKQRMHCMLCRKYHEINPDKGMTVCPHTMQHLIERFFCQICEIKFRTRNELKSHNLNVHKEKNYLCDECGQAFDTSEELGSHVANHMSEKKYMCDICGNRYRGQTSLKRHRLNHFEKQIQCQLCSRKFTRNYLLRLHMATHLNQKTLQCSHCPKFFRSNASLKQHELIKHKTTAKFNCKICNKSFNILRAYKQHMTYKHGSNHYECDLCKRKFQEKIKLKLHIMRHIKQKQVPEDYRFNCTRCEYRFKSVEVLKNHMETHIEEKYFHCDTCNKSCRSLKNLQEHSKCHIKKQTHLCEQCGYICFYGNVLDNHIAKYHSGDKDKNLKIEGFFPQDAQEDEVTERFSCEECQKEFECLALLKVHKDTHLYECASCKKNLRTEKLLSEHIRKEHKTKLQINYKCDLCPESFNLKALLREHLLEHKKTQKKLEITEKKSYKSVKRVQTLVSRKNNVKQSKIDHLDAGNIDTNEQQLQKEIMDIPKIRPKIKKSIEIHTNKTNCKVTSYEKNRQVACQYCDLVFMSYGQLRLHRQIYHSETVGVRKQRKMPKEGDTLIMQNKKDETLHIERVQKVPSNLNLVQGNELNKELCVNDVDISQIENCSFIYINQLFFNDSGTLKENECSIEVSTQLEDLTNKVLIGKLDTKGFQCNQCPLIFCMKLDLVNHFQRTHLENEGSENLLIQCQRCDNNFTKEDVFIAHMTTHDLSIKTLYRCLQCLRTFENEMTLDKHKNQHQNNINKLADYPCPKCEVVYKTRKEMKIHLIKFHQQWQCKYCFMILSTETYQAHLLTHVPQSIAKIDLQEMDKASTEKNVDCENSCFKRLKLRTLHHCPYCYYTFTMFQSLNYHLTKIHKYAKCKPCNLILFTDEMQQHIREVHASDNTFACSVCNATFSNFDKLYYHRRTKHMFKCPECVKMFCPTLEMYKEHLKTHGLKFNNKVHNKSTRNVEYQNANNIENIKTVNKSRLVKQSSTKKLTCDECGKIFQSKKRLENHVKNIFKVKPRFQKIIFRCDTPTKKCNYCKKILKNIEGHYKSGHGECPEKRKETERRFERLKNKMELEIIRVKELKKQQLEMKRLVPERKIDEMAKRTVPVQNKRMKIDNLCKGYKLRMGVPREFKCLQCQSIFYHEDSYDYHINFTCVGKNTNRQIGIKDLKECRIFVEKMKLPDILKSTGNRIISTVENENGKRRRRPPKCFCCKDGSCKTLILTRRKWTRRKNTVAKSSKVNDQNTLNEKEVLDAMDIKIEPETIPDINYSIPMEEESDEDNIISYSDIEHEYEKELESAMEVIKEQFSIFNTMIENNYSYYNRKWIKAGNDFCTLEIAKKAHKERTWNYICYQKQIQFVDITRQNDNKIYDKKQYAWKLKCNILSPPVFVENTIKEFQVFFDYWNTLVEPCLSKQEVINFRKEMIAIEIQADILNNLTVMITVCNENIFIKKAFHQYFVDSNIPNVTNITYRNIRTDEDYKNSFERTLIFGNEINDQVIYGIKVNLADFKCFSQLESLEILTKTIENYLVPNIDITLIEIGCRNGFIGLALSSKYKEVIGIDKKSEIITAINLCEYNDISNVTFKEPTSLFIKTLIENYKDKQLHAIVNVDIEWITNLHVMRYLRNLSFLKSIILITSFSHKVYLPISELIIMEPNFFGYPFVPVRSCVVDRTPGKNEFQIVMLLVREDVYEQKPNIKSEPMDVSDMVENTLNNIKEYC